MKKPPPPDRAAQPGLFNLSPLPAGLPPTVRRVLKTSNDIIDEPPEQTDFLHAILLSGRHAAQRQPGQAF